MITFLVTAAHTFTVGALDKDFGAPLPPCRAMPYDELFTSTRLDRGTYIFCDIERLSDQELLVATEYYRALSGLPGFRVLNDPSRVKTRYALLRSLFERGSNKFNTYRADGYPEPAKYPVFVRAEGAHAKPHTGLLPACRGCSEPMEVRRSRAIGRL